MEDGGGCLELSLSKYITSSSLLSSHQIHWVVIKVWRGGVVVRALDLQQIGLRFQSRPLRFTYNPGQVDHTPVPLFTKQYKLVPAQAGS